jgi:hypothetical protein
MAGDSLLDAVLWKAAELQLQPALENKQSALALDLISPTFPLISPAFH